MSGLAGDPSTAPAYLRQITQTLNNQPFCTYTLTHNYLGLLLGVTGSGAQSSQAAYGYDARGRLSSQQTQYAVNGGSVQSNGTYTYDGSGNLNGGGNGWQYNSNNQLTLAPPTADLPGAAGLSYDAAGNLTGLNGEVFTYDCWGNLTRADNTPSGTVTYAYDSGGRCISKSVGGATTYYVYDGEDVAGETDSTGATTRTYSWGALGLISDHGSGASNDRYYDYDAHGNTSALADSGGNVSGRGAYTPYGSPLGQELPTPYTWQGQSGNRHEREMGLYTRSSAPPYVPAAPTYVRLVFGIMNKQHTKRYPLEVLAIALLALGIGVHLLFLLSLKFGWLNGLFNDSMHRFGPGGDFFSIYAAGVKARHGESVYTIGGHVPQVPYAYAFRYAPLVAYTLGLAFSFLPALSAYGLWLVGCELALLRNIRLTVECAPNKPVACLAAALWLLFSPYYLELYVGQFTFLTASLVFWAYLAWHDEAHAPAGLRRLGRWGDGCFALAVWLKMMPLLFLPLALWRGRGRSAFATIATLAATSAVYFARHPGDWAVFLDINGEPTPTWHAGNQGLMAFLYAAVGESAKGFADARLFALIVVGGGVAWLWFRLLRVTKETKTSGLRPGVPSTQAETQALVLYAACSAAYLLLYKDVWEHHYVVLLPPLVLLALRGEPARLWLPPFVICALPTLFALYDARGLGYNEDPQRYWQSGVSLLHHGWKPLAPLWLFGGILWRDVSAYRQSLCHNAEPKPQTRWGSASTRGRWGAALAGCLVLVAGGKWAGNAIAAQRRVTRQLAWPDALFQLQQRKETCGPAALAAVCRYYGIPAEESELARLAGTRWNGTTMLGLQQAAQAKGLSAEGQERSVEELASLPRPCILYFHQGHFAVLTGVQNDLYYVADPSLGQRVWTSRQLAYLWRGELLLVGPAH